MPVRIAYRQLRGYKYRLARPHRETVSIRPQLPIVQAGGYVSLDLGGSLEIFAGYCWDGCSGPTWDDATNMRGGLVHDALYQLMRLGVLPFSMRGQVDELFRHMLISDGMWEFRARYYHWAVSTFAAGAARPGTEPKRPVLWAP